MAEINIRRAIKDDISYTERIRIDMWAIAYKDIFPQRIFDEMDYEANVERKKAKFDTMPAGYVAEVNGEVVGFVNIDETLDEDGNKQAELAGLYVKPHITRNGVGSSLFSYAKQKFREKGYSKMILWCLKDNTMGKSFYVHKQKGKIVQEKEIEIRGAKAIEEKIEFVL